LTGDDRLRPARLDDADVLAELVNHAGDGLPLYLWGQMAEPGETAWDVGRRRARRDEGAFSWRNALIADDGDGAVGCLIGYMVPDDPGPPGEMPAMFVPLDALEREAPGTWYVNVLAVLPEARGRGLGSLLIGAARDRAVEQGARGNSLIVSDANAGARRLYARHGYAEVAERPMVKSGWRNRGERWILMTRAP
jgi:ribosomal protein S18 acetylase RimI-like enzyme